MAVVARRWEIAIVAGLVRGKRTVHVLTVVARCWEMAIVAGLIRTDCLWPRLHVECDVRSAG